MAAGTLAANAAMNRIMPFHPGAARYYSEAGIKLERALSKNPLPCQQGRKQGF